MKKLSSYSGMIVGFVLGIGLMVSCGGGAVQEAVADVIGAATDVTYSNTTSGLASTTVQDALDELAAGEYTDAAAVTAMGTKANSNALNHDRYTDAEAVTAMGTKGNSNSLNHDRYTDAEAVSAVNAATNIDADTLDGVDSSSFVQASSSPTLGTVTATNLSFVSAKTGYLNISGVAFTNASIADGGDAGSDLDGSYAYGSSSGAKTGNSSAPVTVVSPVNLPNGAIVTTLTLNSNDTASDITLSLNRFSNTGTNTSMASVSSSATSVSTTTISSATIANDSNSYYVSADINGSGDQLRSALITYTYLSPTF